MFGDFDNPESMIMWCARGPRSPTSPPRVRHFFRGHGKPPPPPVPPAKKAVPSSAVPPPKKAVVPKTPDIEHIMAVTPPSRRPLGELDANSLTARAIATPAKPSREIPFAIAEPVATPAEITEWKKPARGRGGVALVAAVVCAIVYATHVSRAAPPTMLLEKPPPNYVLVPPRPAPTTAAPTPEPRVVRESLAPAVPAAPEPVPASPNARAEPFAPIVPAEPFVFLCPGAPDAAATDPGAPAAAATVRVAPRQPSLDFRHSRVLVVHPAARLRGRAERLLALARLLIKPFRPPPRAACITPFACV